ncbi:MAG: histone acetyltransferase [Halobacterium sp.]
MPGRLSLDELRPSQLYLSGEKLAAAAEWFDFDEPNYGTLPVFEYDGEWFLSDGHTRAFLAHLTGFEDVRVERDDGLREEYDVGVYEAAIGWCEDEGVTRVADLAGRVVEPTTYEDVWIERCQRYDGDGG